MSPLNFVVCIMRAGQKFQTKESHANNPTRLHWMVSLSPLFQPMLQLLNFSSFNFLLQIAIKCVAIAKNWSIHIIYLVIEWVIFISIFKINIPILTAPWSVTMQFGTNI